MFRHRLMQVILLTVSLLWRTAYASESTKVDTSVPTAIASNSPSTTPSSSRTPTAKASSAPSSTPTISHTPTVTASSSPSSTPSSSRSPSTTVMQEIFIAKIMEPLGSIAGNVKEDTDMDEIGDRNIPNVLIQLLDRTGFMIKSTVTDSHGNYLFTDLTADIYVVRERNIFEVPFDVSDIDRGNKNAILVKIGLNGAPLDSSGNDFVDKKGPLVTGLVLEDVDDDTIGDTPIPGVVITLRESNTTVSTTLTDSSGRFIFAADPSKVYSIVEINKSGYSDVTDSDGNDPNYIDNVSSAGKDNIFVDKRKMLR